VNLPHIHMIKLDVICDSIKQHRIPVIILFSLVVFWVSFTKIINNNEPVILEANPILTPSYDGLVTKPEDLNENLPNDFSVRNDIIIHRFDNKFGKYSLALFGELIDENTNTILKNNGIFEPFLLDIYESIIDTGLVLDFGSNIGDFSVIAALNGDTVVALEMVSDLRLCLKLSKFINNLSNLHIPNYLISNEKTVYRYSIKSLYKDLQFGTATPSPDGDKLIPVIDFESSIWANKEIKIVKIDIEGHIIPIFKALKKSMDQKLIKNFVFELWHWEIEATIYLTMYECKMINISGVPEKDNFSMISVFKDKIQKIFDKRKNVFINIWCVLHTV
jgi:FkbM family methyltransferase